jgi:hypothetical protein
MLKQRRIVNYLIALLLVIAGPLGIQFKWFFDEIVEDEKEAHHQISRAVCRAFATIANKDKMSGNSTQCANLGGGEFEIHTGTMLSGIDSVVRKELFRVDKIVPFKITVASQAGSPALRLERADSYRMAHVDVAIPTRSKLFVNQINEGGVLYFVFVSLIGVVFYNVFKSIKEERQYSDDFSDHEKDNTYSIGRYTFDSGNHVLRIGQTERRITKKEIRFFSYYAVKRIRSSGAMIY